MPTQSASSRFVTALMGKLATRALVSDSIDADAAADVLNDYIASAFEGALATLRKVAEVVAAVNASSGDDPDQAQAQKKYLDLAAKSSILGSLLPTALALHNHLPRFLKQSYASEPAKIYIHNLPH
jgi:hypothetical protein